MPVRRTKRPMKTNTEPKGRAKRWMRDWEGAGELGWLAEMVKSWTSAVWHM